MKKLFFAATVIATLVACNQTSYKISGEVTGFKEGEKVLLKKINENGQPIAIDSTTISGNKFEFKGESNEIEESFVLIGGTSDNEAFVVPLILENGTIKLLADKSDPTKSKVTGSKNNDDLTRFNEIAYPITEKIQAFQEANQAKFQKAVAEQDMATMQALMNEMNTEQKKLTDEGLKFIDNNKDSYVSLLLLSQFGNTMSQDDMKTKFDKLSEEVKNTKLGKELLKFLNTSAPVVQPVPVEAETTPSTENTAKEQK